MKKNKILKTLGLFGCAILLVAVSIAGTVAYLTSTTGTVTNTFTVGSVNITLDEAKVDLYGVKADPEVRVTADNKYKLIPGHTYVKDPTVHVLEGSENCWLFVKVVNNISAIETTDDNTKTIAGQMAANGWVAVDGVANVYYHEPVDARTAAQDVNVFESFTVKTDAAVNSYNGKTVEITAYAIQADGFGNNAKDVWTAAGFN